jgi:hypothetical protein
MHPLAEDNAWVKPKVIPFFIPNGGNPYRTYFERTRDPPFVPLRKGDNILYIKDKVILFDEAIYKLILWLMKEKNPNPILFPVAYEVWVIKVSELRMGVPKAVNMELSVFLVGWSKHLFKLT